jgi:hypothetical protein
VDARGRVAAESTVSPTVASSATFLLNTNTTTTVIDGFSFTGGTSLGVIQTQSGTDFSNLQIRNNRFSGYSQSAVFMNRAGSNITIDKNVMDGSNIAGSGQAIFCNGPQSFAGLFITNNNIINNKGRYGFFVDGNHNVGESLTRAPSISGNLFDNNSTGMNLGSRSFGVLGTPVLGTYGGTISNNTFSNHTANGIQAGIQHVLVTGNTFSGNAIDGLALTNLGSAGVDRGGQNSLITGNTFTTSGRAGIFFSGAQNVGLIETNHANFNRIFGNAVGVQYGGSVAAGNNAIIDVENNWWGCNFGPGTGGAGCSSTPNGTLVFAGNTGILDADPWIVLGTSASPSTINTGSTSTVTADMTKNSAAASPAGGAVPLIPVAFGATNGTMTPTSGTIGAITPGQATSMFTSTSTNLSATASSTVDNQAISTNITVLSPSNVFGTKTFSGTRFTASTVTYTVVLSNTNTTPQLDNPTDEFTDTLPSSLTLVSATPTSGTASTASNTVTWNGMIAGSGSVTITITATVNLVPDTTPVSNQGTINYDFDGNHTNESNRPTDDPAVVGASNPTVFNAADTNDPPDAVNDAVGSVAEDSGQRTITIASLLDNDNTGPANESGQTLMLTTVSNAVGGTVTKDATNVFFTPAADFNGPASFDYTVTDNGTTDGANDFKSDTATVSFTVTEVNDAPTAVNDVLASVAEDSGQRIIPFSDLTGNDNKGAANESGQTLIVKTVGDEPVGGTAVLDTPNSRVLFTPTANYFGPASFDYTVEDNGTTNGGSDPKTSALAATASFTITPVADTPSVTDATTSINTQTESDLFISRNPVDGDEVTHFKITNITNGTLFQTDGTTPINNGDFITYAQASTGLKFTPATGLSSPTSTFKFDIQASISDNDTGLGGSVITAMITVNPSLTLTVNTLGDAPDLGGFNGVCDSDDVTPGNQCTLRAAIQETNAAASADAINFSLPANSTITLTSALEDINGNLNITGPASGVTVSGSNSVDNLFSVFSVRAKKIVSISNLTITNGVAIKGGGIANLGYLTIRNSTITGNKALVQSGGIDADLGELIMINSTISGNSSDVDGGGITMEDASSAYLMNVTIVNNRADADGDLSGTGGGFKVRLNSPVLINTIIAGNFTGASPGTAPDDISGDADESSRNNLMGTGGSGGLTNGPPNNNQVGVSDARLAALANNGGPTPTHALLVASPALDAGNNCVTVNLCFAGTVTTDQRGSGFARKVDGPDADTTDTVDIGAFEAQVSIQDIPDRSMPEDGSDSFSFNVGGAATITSVTATSSNTGLVPNNAANLSVSGSGSTRTLTINPAANQNGSTVITVTVNSASGSMTDSFGLTVWEVNDAPAAVNDTLSNVAEDSGQRTILGSTLTANDSKGPANESGQTLIVKTVGNAVGGIVSLVGGNVLFTTTADYNGPASFDYTVEDNGTTNGAPDPKTSGIAKASFIITEVNDAPVAFNDPLGNMTEDAPQRTIPFSVLTGNDSKGPANESGQTLIVKTVSNPVGLTVSIVAGTVRFTPLPDYNGPASFQYTVEDNGTTNGVADPKTSGQALVHFNITEVNDAPAAVNDTLTNVAEDSGPRTIPFATLTGNDSKGPANESGQTLIVKTVGNAVGGTVSIGGGNVLFTPTADYNGPASFQYTVEDNGTTNGVADPLSSGIATVSFTITEVNDAPTAVNDTLTNVAEDSGPRTIPFATLTGNDSKGPANESGQTLTVKTVGNAIGGTVSIVAGNVVFTPTADYNGPASFQYTVEDNGTTNGAADRRTSAAATASFNITAVSDTPSVTNATTNANTQTTSGLVISRNPADGAEVTHFKITGITGGLLFKNNGTTPINNGDFITFAEGNAGLKFTPGTVNGSFLVQASLSASNAGLGGGIVQATIIINPLGGVIRFSAADYSVAEGAGFRVITVERSGDTSQAVTVDYASSDHSTPADFVPCTAPGAGQASSRCDFTTAIGTLRFAAGETSKTFIVLISNDNYVEGPETLSLTLSNPSGGAVFGVPQTATLTIVDDASEGATNPIDISSFFVTAHYHDFLKREPDAAGLAFWTDNIEKCNDSNRRPAGQTAAQCIDKQRESTAIAFFMSPEFQMTGGFVYHLYKGSLTGAPNYDGGSPGRFPTFLEFMHDMSQVSEGIVVNNQISGAVIEANRNALAAEFVQRPEFVAKYGGLINDTLYVQELFNTTGIAATPAQKQALVDGLANHTETRASVLRKVVDGTVVISEANVQFTTPYGQAFINQENRRLFVYLEYIGYLRRNPDTAGFVFWLGKLNFFNGDAFQAEMVRSFILSPEYRSRFGQP